MCVSARTLKDVQQPVKPHAHLAPKSDVYLLRSDGLSCSREIVEGETAGMHPWRGARRTTSHDGNPGPGVPRARLARAFDPTPSILLPPRAANGSLSFACTSSQQHLLVWKQRPKW